MGADGGEFVISGAHKYEIDADGMMYRQAIHRGLQQGSWDVVAGQAVRRRLVRTFAQRIFGVKVGGCAGGVAGLRQARADVEVVDEVDARDDSVANFDYRRRRRRELSGF